METHCFRIFRGWSGRPILFSLFPTLYLLSFSIPLHAAFQGSQWGARPAGMGGAYVGIAHDVNALFYNPSGASRATRPQSAFMYTKPLAGLDQVNLNKSLFAVVVPVAKGDCLGAFWSNLNSPHYRENVASLSYAAGLDRWVSSVAPGGASVGVDFNYLSHEYVLNDLALLDPVFRGGRRATAYSVGFSFLAKPPSDLLPGIQVGGAGRNLNEPDVGIHVEDRVPRELALGVGYERRGARFDADVVRRENVTEVRVGAEFWILSNALSTNQFVLRGGGDRNGVSAGMTFGRSPRDRNGRALFSMGVDYAFIVPLYVSNASGTHVVALNVGF